ncbi:DUF3871 family protein [Hymenobacter gummosus]|uniref:DUF3871 family protein n=2 Tax=Hymenobacter gummosus TaxID=1776032 RepID=A0A3S0JHR5_9BACT|nr:DUF3871 family protein [Hymenobacter gummosus]
MRLSPATPTPTTNLHIVREPGTQVPGSSASSTSRAFIEANTIVVTPEEIRRDHIIPVYARDNEPLISQGDFIQVAEEVVYDVFRGERILEPQIRVSHPIKGRIPEARNKPANQLEDHERTIYYERLAFCIELPSIYDYVGGNQLSLVVGGVKAYNLDNVSGRRGSAEHFKLFIGFQNLVCTNLCVRTDGYIGDLRVGSLDQLRAAVYQLISSYEQHRHLRQMQALTEYALTEHQFAQLIGRCRMYQHLPAAARQQIPALLYGDQQLGTVCRDYYRDERFCRDDNGNINLWRLYNLFTNACKSTYVDQFLDRSINALDFTLQVQDAVEGRATSWYLS